MSYPTPSQTPESQCQRLAESEQSPKSSPSTPTKNRASAVLSSPINFLRRLGHPTPSPSVVSPSRTGSARSPEETPERSSDERDLAPLRNSRQRQRARRSRVSRLISFIEELQNDGYVGRKETIHKTLLPKEYTELLLEVDKLDRRFQLYFNNSLRYAYKESRYGKNQFTIFMASAFHNRVQRAVESDIVLWKAQVMGNKRKASGVRKAAGNIRSAGECKIITETSFLAPDSSYEYEGDDSYPPIVFEIAWTQETEDLHSRAIELIKASESEVRTVVGWDFSGTEKMWERIQDNIGTGEAPNRGPATAFVWRAVLDKNGRQIFKQDGEPRVWKRSYRFFDDDGTVQQGAKLQLSLKDFVPMKVILKERWDKVKKLDNTKLVFDSATVVNYFNEALKAQKLEYQRKKPQRERKAREKLELKQEQEAARSVVAEKEHRRWSIRDIVPIGGHYLRRR